MSSLSGNEFSGPRFSDHARSSASDPEALACPATEPPPPSSSAKDSEFRRCSIGIEPARNTAFTSHPLSCMRIATPRSRGPRRASTTSWDSTPVTHADVIAWRRATTQDPGIARRGCELQSVRLP